MYFLFTFESLRNSSLVIMKGLKRSFFRHTLLAAATACFGTSLSTAFNPSLTAIGRDNGTETIGVTFWEAGISGYLTGLYTNNNITNSLEGKDDDQIDSVHPSVAALVEGAIDEKHHHLIARIHADFRKLGHLLHRRTKSTREHGSF